MSPGGDPSDVGLSRMWTGHPHTLVPARAVAQGRGTGVQGLPLVRPPVVHVGIEGDALLLTEAPPVRRTLLGREKTGREELGPTKAFLSRLSRKWPQPEGWPLLSASQSHSLGEGVRTSGRAATIPQTPTCAGPPGALGGDPFISPLPQPSPLLCVPIGSIALRPPVVAAAPGTQRSASERKSPGGRGEAWGGRGGAAGHAGTGMRT